MSLGFTMAANAALVDRGNRLIYQYDPDLPALPGITWLANANLADTNAFGVSGIDADGSMNWETANQWIAAMNTAEYLGINNWRLPATPVPDSTCTVPQPAFGTGCTGSELGDMYKTELGGTVTDPLGPNSAPGPGPFTNLQADGYWSGTEFDTRDAYVLNFGFSGAPAADQKFLGYHAWAVRDGDVGEVPAPGFLPWSAGCGEGCFPVTDGKGM
jgi:hypothetical protein